MLPKGPFQSSDFKPDIPEDTLHRLHGNNKKKSNDKREKIEDNKDGVDGARMTARDYIDREQQEKE